MGYIEIPDITLEMIIQAGIIAPNTELFNSYDESIIGILNNDGSITITLNGEIKRFPYPSGAARAIVKLSVNGWIFWKIKGNGELKNLTYYKKQFTKTI